ncbi:DUF2207 domain-containing protein [Erysipelothrix sp. HDW6C]|uniref:DUF2207 domain-containing protein n=1 Tax=Erysipelothrix sp. HDW6C TaxID=2714930 RepID=UPI00196A3DE4|nr:DUF2207 domain-containing protein [Erysipelothrix sp. HDW6C]
MKQIKRITLFFVILLGLLVMPVSAASNDIEGRNLDVKMNVREDGVIEVHETLDVYFNGRNQGIFVVIPQVYEKEFDGVSKTFFFPIKNFKVLSGDEVSIERNREGITARMGEEGVYLSGDKRYEYSYEIHTRQFAPAGRQIIYQNIVSSEWLFPIQNVTFSITMPKPFGLAPQLYATTNNLPVPHEVVGNTISGHYSETLYRQGLSFWLEVEDGYFTYPVFDYTWIGLGLTGLLTALFVALYTKFGKKNPVVESVEFAAPEGISSAEVGYIYRGHNVSKDIVSLIIYWASRGYLTIEELDEKGDNIKLTKLKDLPGSENVEERRVFRELFEGRDEVTTKQLNETFGAVVQHATQTLGKRFSGSKENRVFDRTSSTVKALGSIFLPFGIGLFGGFVSFKTSGYGGDFATGFVVTFVAFMIVTMVGVATLPRDGINNVVKSPTGGMFITLAVAALASLVVYFFIVSGNEELWIFIIVLALFLIGLYFVANMGRRTPKGSRWYGQILGLERFIKVAEEARIRALAEETPEIFYDVLPYAYVLGITDTWVKKFESIAIPKPDWYMSTRSDFTTFYLWSSLNRSMRTINSSMVSVPAPKGSSGGGGSFGGGGGSFGGGGGFGGGGFGGSGGGGW